MACPCAGHGARSGAERLLERHRQAMAERVPTWCRYYHNQRGRGRLLVGLPPDAPTDPPAVALRTRPDRRGVDERENYDLLKRPDSCSSCKKLIAPASSNAVRDAEYFVGCIPICRMTPTSRRGRSISRRFTNDVFAEPGARSPIAQRIHGSRGRTLTLDAWLAGQLGESRPDRSA
jgi:hypothetical protein